MAGDWIKVEHATLNKPEVLEAAELLGMTRREAIGLFMDYFAWLDENMPDSRNGIVTHTSRKSVDDSLHEPGFASVLEVIGWAKFDDLNRTLTVINHDRHNGNTAKTRALGKDRAQRFRNAQRNASVTQSPLPEKRRVLTPIAPNTHSANHKSHNANGSQLPEGFLAFWSVYPAEHRKVDKAKCVAFWKHDKLEGFAETIVEHVKAMADGNSDWKRGYEPAPLKYLKGHRWQDELPVKGKTGVML